MPLRVLRKGVKGSDVKHWQIFLIGRGFKDILTDGEFGAKTHNATVEFQKQNNLLADGVVGNKTFAKAMELGFELIEDTEDTSTTGPNFPPPPAFPPLVSNAARQKIFGTIEFRRKPLPNNKENIVITNGWDKENIEKIIVPQLVGVEGAPHDGGVFFHRLARKQLLDMWAGWEKAKLRDRVLSWSGSYVPRLVRGTKNTLSNHCFGTAFDVNVPFNFLGSMPALVGRKGSVRELVKIANDNGFYWGGHFKGRKDGMHFEVAEVR
ncbi:MAG TPA: M15 family metallopeptidase [Pyrinomonadaceae bacterium]|nr:M15 family metallopeptidase [Pyrinomonadaceae bacterium]